MALTGAQIVAEVCDTVGKALTATSRSGMQLQTRALMYINFGQKRIARHYNFHELDNLQDSAATVDTVKRYPMVSGTNNFGLIRPKDIYSVRLMDSENSKVIQRRHRRWFDKHYPRPENYSGGRPDIYIRDGNYLEFFRIPNGTFDIYIRYPQWPTDLTTGSSSDFENKDQMIITAGIFETYFALEEYIDAKVWYEKFLGQLHDAVRAEGDVDWEPVAEGSGDFGYTSASPWIDPYGQSSDPLSGYAD